MVSWKFEELPGHGQPARIYFELVDQSGKVVGSYVSQNAIQPSLEYQSINVDLPYKVSKATWVRLIMHQVDIRNGKDVAVSSIILNYIHKL